MIRPRTAVVALVMLGLGVVAGRSTHHCPKPSITEREADELAGLRRNMPPIDFAIEAPSLKAAIDWLRQHGDLKIDVDWCSSRYGGLPDFADAPVTVATDTPTPSGVLLEMIGEQLRRNGFQIEHVIQDDGRIRVFLGDEIGANGVVIRMYDIHRIIGQVASYDSRQEQVDAIIRLIENTIESETWKDNGGEIGSIREIGNVIIVSSHFRVQRKIESLLNNLEMHVSLARRNCGANEK